MSRLDNRNGCPFCKRVRRKEYMTTSFPEVVAFEPLNPVVPGHMLFIPRVHVNNPLMIGKTFAIAQKYGLFKQGRGSKPDFNLIINQGTNAGQTISHPHVHYVPRGEGDGLLLPWDKP